MRPIDADWLLDVVENIIKWDTERDRNRIIHQVRELTPTIEPERKKGKWIEQDDGWDGVYYECSCCKEAFTLMDGTPSDNLYNYSPNCGVRMKE